MLLADETVALTLEMRSPYMYAASALDTGSGSPSASFLISLNLEYSLGLETMLDRQLLTPRRVSAFKQSLR